MGSQKATTIKAPAAHTATYGVSMDSGGFSRQEATGTKLGLLREAGTIMGLSSGLAVLMWTLHPLANSTGGHT